MAKAHWTQYLRGRQRPGEMNKTEAAYAEGLEGRRLAGEILWYAFEPITLHLAKRLSYRPDFLVMTADGTLEVHEVKGFWADDARVKLRAAAEKFPFRFVAAVRGKKGQGWTFEEF